MNRLDRIKQLSNPTEAGIRRCFSELERIARDAVEESERLRKAIETHRSQKADDRCIEDDDRLYEALGDGIKCDRRVGDKPAMLANCARFIERRCQGGGWPTYAELEDSLGESLKVLLEVAHSPFTYGDSDDIRKVAANPCYGRDPGRQLFTNDYVALAVRIVRVMDASATCASRPSAGVASTPHACPEAAAGEASPHP